MKEKNFVFILNVMLSLILITKLIIVMKNQMKEDKELPPTNGD